MLFKTQIAFNNHDGQRRKCTMIVQANSHDHAPTEIKSVAAAYFSAALDTVEILSLDGVHGNFAVLGRWPH